MQFRPFLRVQSSQPFEKTCSHCSSVAGHLILHIWVMGLFSAIIRLCWSRGLIYWNEACTKSMSALYSPWVESRQWQAYCMPASLLEGKYLRQSMTRVINCCGFNQRLGMKWLEWMSVVAKSPFHFIPRTRLSSLLLSRGAAAMQWWNSLIGENQPFAPVHIAYMQCDNNENEMSIYKIEKALRKHL